MCGPRVSNPTHVQLNWICGKDSRSFLHSRAYMRLEIRLVFFGIQNQSKEIERKFNVQETTGLSHRPRLQKNMIAIHLDSGKKDLTGVLLSLERQKTSL